MRYVKKRECDSRREGPDDEPCAELQRPESGRRVEQHEETQAERNGRQRDVWMSSAETRTQTIRQRAGQRIDDRIYEKRNEKCDPGDGPRETEHLVVVEKEKRTEADRHHRFAQLAEAVGDHHG